MAYPPAVLGNEVPAERGGHEATFGMADNEAAPEARIPGVDYEPKPGGSENARQKANGSAPASYSMLEPRMKAIYGQFYKETYFSENKHLEPKVQELIALACSLIAQCEGCLDGHVKKALKLGATREEISEAIVIAIGINAAAIVDQTDRTAARLGLNHFPAKTRL